MVTMKWITLLLAVLSVAVISAVSAEPTIDERVYSTQAECDALKQIVENLGDNEENPYQSINRVCKDGLNALKYVILDRLDAKNKNPLPLTINNKEVLVEKAFIRTGAKRANFKEKFEDLINMKYDPKDAQKIVDKIIKCHEFKEEARFQRCVHTLFCMKKKYMIANGIDYEEHKNMFPITYKSVNAFTQTPPDMNTDDCPAGNWNDDYDDDAVVPATTEAPQPEQKPETTEPKAENNEVEAEPPKKLRKKKRIVKKKAAADTASESDTDNNGDNDDSGEKNNGVAKKEEGNNPELENPSVADSKVTETEPPKPVKPKLKKKKKVVKKVQSVNDNNASNENKDNKNGDDDDNDSNENQASNGNEVKKESDNNKASVQENVKTEDESKKNQESDYEPVDDEQPSKRLLKKKSGVVKSLEESAPTTVSEVKKPDIPEASKTIEPKEGESGFEKPSQQDSMSADSNKKPTNDHESKTDDITEYAPVEDEQPSRKLLKKKSSVSKSLDPPQDSPSTSASGTKLDSTKESDDKKTTTLEVSKTTDSKGEETGSETPSQLTTKDTNKESTNNNESKTSKPASVDNFDLAPVEEEKPRKKIVKKKSNVNKSMDTQAKEGSSSASKKAKVPETDGKGEDKGSEKSSTDSTLNNSDKKSYTNNENSNTKKPASDDNPDYTPAENEQPKKKLFRKNSSVFKSMDTETKNGISSSSASKKASPETDSNVEENGSEKSSKLDSTSTDSSKKSAIDKIYDLTFYGKSKTEKNDFDSAPAEGEQPNRKLFKKASTSVVKEAKTPPAKQGLFTKWFSASPNPPSVPAPKPVVSVASASQVAVSPSNGVKSSLLATIRKHSDSDYINPYEVRRATKLVIQTVIHIIYSFLNGWRGRSSDQNGRLRLSQMEAFAIDSMAEGINNGLMRMVFPNVPWMGPSTSGMFPSSSMYPQNPLVELGYTMLNNQNEIPQDDSEPQKSKKNQKKRYDTKSLTEEAPEGPGTRDMYTVYNDEVKTGEGQTDSVIKPVDVDKNKIFGTEAQNNGALNILKGNLMAKVKSFSAATQAPPTQ